MPRFKRLDDLSRQLQEAQQALAAIDGKIGTVNFDPYDPASIEHAIQAMALMIDERVGIYARNPIVAPLIDQAAAARLGDGQVE